MEHECALLLTLFLCIEQTILGMICDLAFNCFAMAGVTYVADKWSSLGVHGKCAWIWHVVCGVHGKCAWVWHCGVLLSCGVHTPHARMYAHHVSHPMHTTWHTHARRKTIQFELHKQQWSCILTNTHDATGWQTRTHGWALSRAGKGIILVISPVEARYLKCWHESATRDERCWHSMRAGDSLATDEMIRDGKAIVTRKQNILIFKIN